MYASEPIISPSTRAGKLRSSTTADLPAPGLALSDAQLSSPLASLYDSSIDCELVQSAVLVVQLPVPSFITRLPSPTFDDPRAPMDLGPEPPRRSCHFTSDGSTAVEPVSLIDVRRGDETLRDVAFLCQASWSTADRQEGSVNEVRELYGAAQQ